MSAPTFSKFGLPTPLGICRRALSYLDASLLFHRSNDFKRSHYPHAHRFSLAMNSGAIQCTATMSLPPSAAILCTKPQKWLEVHHAGSRT